MIFRKPPKPPPEPPKPQWFRLGLIIFILIVLMIASKPDEQTGKSGWDQASTRISEGLPDFASYRRFIPGGSDTKVFTVKAGNGRAPICGQTVTVKLAGYVRDEKVSRDREETFRLGAKEISPQLSNAIMQMQPGGEYRIGLDKAVAIPALLGKPVTDEEKVTNIEATLLSISPDISALFAENRLSLRAIDTERGSGAEAACGDRVEVRITAYAENGNRHEPITATLDLGSNTQMAGLEQGVLGLAPGGSRTLLIPPAWQKPLLPSNDKPVIEAQQSIVILEIMRIP